MVNSNPIIWLVSGDRAFMAEIAEWPRGPYEVSSRAGDGLRLICIGPDISKEEAGSLLEAYPQARFMWFRNSWTIPEIELLEPKWLPRLSLMDMSDHRHLRETWLKVLRTTDVDRPDVLETLSKRALKSSGERLENLMNFLKILTGVNSIFELLEHLRAEMRLMPLVGEPILLLSRRKGGSEIFYFRGPESHVRHVDVRAPVGHRIRIQDALDRQFLANQLGRPFGKILAFPLAQERSSGWQIEPVIYFEHQMSDADLNGFISDVSQRLQAVSLALDRLIVETELRRASALWEKTFDGIQEPIAIVGLTGEIVRSNLQFAAMDLNGNEDGVIRVRDKVFRVGRYDIRIKGRGPVLSTIVHFSDITKSIWLRERMIQLEKMSAIGHLAGHIAHELNNPLTGISSLAQILARETEGQLREDLIEVQGAAQRCQGIITNLLEFSRGGLDARTLICDLNNIVTKTLPFLKSAIGQHTSLIEVGEVPIWVEVEPHLMQQVVFNLVNNSCQAVEDRSGEICIRTSETFRSGKRFAELMIRDNGPGVPENLRDAIFEPFFTTKKEGQGTGLGLSFSRDFVRKLGGEIVLESSPSGGALFRVLLPYAEEKRSGLAS